MLKKNNLMNFLGKYVFYLVFLAHCSLNLVKSRLLFLENILDEKDDNCIQEFVSKIFLRANINNCLQR